MHDGSFSLSDTCHLIGPPERGDAAFVAPKNGATADRIVGATQP
jgi:hypothetical protein